MSADTEKYGYIFRYIYAVVGILLLGAAAVILTLVNAQRSDREALDRIAYFHIRSTTLAEQLRIETDSLAGLLFEEDRAEDTASIAGVRQTRPGASATLQTMALKVSRLADLQASYGGAEFAATLQRIEDRLAAVTRLAGGDAEQGLVRDALAVLELAILQFYRQHVVAEELLLAQLEKTSEHLPPLIGFIVAILVICGVAAWLAIRMLKRSIDRRMLVEQALADSQQRVYQMQKLDALGLLVGGIAHDFNNLLTAILGQTSLMLDDRPEDDDTREGLQDIQEAATHAADLTRQLLAFSRPQDQELRVLDLADLVNGMTGMLRRVLRESIELQVRADVPVDPIEADETQLQQVILNLAINAGDAMPKGGTLTISVDNTEVSAAEATDAGIPAGRFVRMVVADTGVGMDADTQQRAFEPFFTTKTRGRGTGLGLSTVHGIVGAANGHISITSRPDAGSVFDIRIPVSEKRIDATGSEQRPEEEIGGSEFVLVVEDEAQIRTFLQYGLRRLGYRVVAAPDADAGLDVCEKERGRIDAIVSDLIMPGKNGAEFMREASRLQPDAVGIFISGYTDDIIDRDGFEDLGVPLLRKPFDIRELASLIRRELAARDSGGGRRSRRSAGPGAG